MNPGISSLTKQDSESRTTTRKPQASTNMWNINGSPSFGIPGTSSSGEPLLPSPAALSSEFSSVLNRLQGALAKAQKGVTGNNNGDSAMLDSANDGKVKFLKQGQQNINSFDLSVDDGKEKNANKDKQPNDNYASLNNNNIITSSDGVLDLYRPLDNKKGNAAVSKVSVYSSNIGNYSEDGEFTTDYEILDDDSDDTEDIISTTKATKIATQKPTSASTFPSAPVQNTISTTLERNSTRLNLLQLYTQKFQSKANRTH